MPTRRTVLIGTMAVCAWLAAACGSGDSAPPPTPDREDPAFDARPNATVRFGELADAVYRIEIPDDWNGELVLWAHGYRAPGEALRASSPPAALRSAFVEGGYAWAASSYSENGYVPGTGMDDTLALAEHFATEFGEPTRTYLAGESMGGAVIALSLEQHPDEFDGALTLCGAVGVVEEIDYLLSWATVAEYLAGADLPLGEADTSGLAAQILYSVIPALGDGDGPTGVGEAFANVMMHLTGGPRPFYREGLAIQFTFNFGLVLVDPSREDLITRAGTNEGVVYAIDPGLGVTPEELNAGVDRLAADEEARNPRDNPETAPLSGRITVPVLGLHTTGDMFVPISQAVAYREKVEAAGAGDLLVQRAIRAPRHCEFSDDEVTTAWADLVAWTEGRGRPAGDDFLGPLDDIGTQFTTPLRAGDPGTIR